MGLIAKTGLTYPDAESLAIVVKAGGISQLSAEDRARVKLRRVQPGEPCDDLPEQSVAHHIERGDIERVAGTPKGRK